MDQTLSEFLHALCEEGRVHDVAEPDRLRHRSNLHPDSAAVLAMLTRAAGARSVLELGTSNGYSTLWLADAVRDTGGRVVTVDVSADAHARAAANLRTVGLDTYVELLTADGSHVLAELPDAEVDVVFLDVRPKSLYGRWWPELSRVLRPGGLLVADNAVSHAEEVSDFLTAAWSSPAFETVTVPVGAGLFVAWRRR
ncbi:hypothetical protein TH66_14655 [Carbonactinospora thermoautotrophica]|uniref:O-methyltransferase n=1 Tax=Carbonactinospora thermoautotrophica TaxID=1469144 RepID=A0A132MQZ8_9ACTN|nr:class I SAM-dependent methyltransferase [Carbonactinospora thermoautotrophica]KWX00150.1 hypothetical protein TH66_14655 [Carbonactinospora thermoautotrophica]KWX01869.1 O-methyltransferase [Carbonactinospora thermoautotrophica]KWX09922.1 hypothetical protein TR74_06725 [Carbonactinospora thermoautotrophica]